MNRVVSADDMAPQILVEPQPTGEVVLVGSPPPRVVCAQPVGTLVDQTQPDAVVVDVRPPIPLVTEQKLEQVVLAGVRGRAGPRGQPGPAGGASFIRIAGEPISALRALYELPTGRVHPLSPDDVDHIDLLVGVSVTSGGIGSEITVQRSGVLDAAGLGLSPGRVWLGEQGRMAQTPPDGGFDVLLGYATAEQRLYIDISESIELEN